MKPGLALAAMLALAAPGCGRAAPLVTVEQLLAQCDAFKGKPVQLTGYLGECAGYECQLAADQSRWAAFVSAFKQTSLPQSDAQRRQAWERVWAIPVIGVGSNDAFDRKVPPFQHSYVVISGTIAKDSCDGRGGTDRSFGIDPTDIRTWTTSEGAPASAK